MRTTAGSHTSSSILRRSSDTVVPGYSFPSTPQPVRHVADGFGVDPGNLEVVLADRHAPSHLQHGLAVVGQGRRVRARDEVNGDCRVAVDQLPAQFREAVDAEDVIHGAFVLGLCARVALQPLRSLRGRLPGALRLGLLQFSAMLQIVVVEIRLAARPTVHLDQSPVGRNRPGTRVHLEHLRRSSRHFAELRQMHFAAHLPVGVLA